MVRSVSANISQVARETLVDCPMSFEYTLRQALRSPTLSAVVAVATPSSLASRDLYSGRDVGFRRLACRNHKRHHTNPRRDLVTRHTKMSDERGVKSSLDSLWRNLKHSR
jgi:hypothetical protein